MPTKSPSSPQSARPPQIPTDIPDSELFDKLGEDNLCAEVRAEVRAETPAERLLSQEWRWSRGQFSDSASLVTVRGGAKVVLSITDFLKPGKPGKSTPDLAVRTIDGHGLLTRITPDHPVARAVVAVPELVAAVVATAELRHHWQECDYCDDGSPCDLGESLDNLCAYLNQHANARAVHGKPLPADFEEHVASCHVVIEQARIDWDINIARKEDTV